MKTIGLIGGTSWVSTADYYRYLNEAVSKRLGGAHSARVVLSSIDFDGLEKALGTQQWDDATAILLAEARRLETAGVDFIALCSNTIHKFFEAVQAGVSVPLLHIVDALAVEISARAYGTVAVLGTRITMEQPFYAGRLEEKSGARVIVPSDGDRAFIDEAIFSRMCRNVYTDEDRTRFLTIIDGLKAQGAHAVILGCTEIPVLIKEASLPLLDSTFIHCQKLVDRALEA